MQGEPEKSALSSCKGRNRKLNRRISTLAAAACGLVAVVVICALASTLAIRVALKVDPAAAIGG